MTFSLCVRHDYQACHESFSFMFMYLGLIQPLDTDNLKLLNFNDYVVDEEIGPDFCRDTEEE